MITADQIKAARKLLGWSGATLARKANRSALTIARVENSTLNANYAAVTLELIRAALETAGVEFLNHGQPGVRLRDATAADLRAGAALLRQAKPARDIPSNPEGLAGGLKRETDARDERDGKKDGD